MTEPVGDDHRQAELVTALGAVRARIAAACVASGRDPQEVTLVAVTLNARKYLERVQEFIGAPIDMVSTGPDRDHTILLRHPYKA